MCRTLLFPRDPDFVVLISGNMMLMPGLPKVSRAAEIDVDASGEIVGV